MAQWKQIQSLAKNRPEVAIRLANIYKHDRKFLLDIRQSCADWIESINWTGLELNSPDIVDTAQRHFQDLMLKIEYVRQQSGTDVVKKINLDQAKAHLQEYFQRNLPQFLATIQSCLQEEKLLIESCENQDEEDLRGPHAVEQTQENLEIAQKLFDLSSQLQRAELNLNSCAEKQNLFREMYSREQEYLASVQANLQQAPPGPDRDAYEKEYKQRHAALNQQVTSNFQHRILVSEEHKKIAELTKATAGDVWREIDRWKKDIKLQLTGLAKPKEGTIDVLDQMCNKMNQNVLQLLVQLDKLGRLVDELRFGGSQDVTRANVDAALLMAEQLLKEHLAKLFVVDKQPPRVLKVITGKSLGFAMSCRFLGGNAFGLQNNPPKVSAELHKEQDLFAVLETPGKKGMCNVANGKDKQLELQRENKQWVAHFNSVQLHNVKSLERNNDKLVMENMNAMVFTMRIHFRSKEYHLVTVSLPIVLISHVLQDCQAKGFLMWDAAFSKDDNERRLFEHPEEVAWRDVARLLDSLFTVHTGRGLQEEHLIYLGRIAFKEKRQPDPAVLNQRKISKSQLIKDKLQKDFQFWKWFYANMNLIKERLKNEWADGLIYGFIAKDETRLKLQCMPPGTFMLRFSESDIENSNKADICGCLTMAVIEKDPESDSNRVYHVKEHLTPKDIFERGLATTLEAFEVKDSTTGTKRPLLKFLYPKREFQTTFQKYLHQKQKGLKDDGDGYKGGQLRIEIFLADDRRRQDSCTSVAPLSPMSPGLSDVSYPRTPHSVGQLTTDGDDWSEPSPTNLVSQVSIMGTKRLKPEPSNPGKQRAIAMVQPTFSEHATFNAASPFSTVTSPMMSDHMVNSPSAHGMPSPGGQIAMVMSSTANSIMVSDSVDVNQPFMHMSLDQSQEMVYNQGNGEVFMSHQGMPTAHLEVIYENTPGMAANEEIQFDNLREMNSGGSDVAMVAANYFDNLSGDDIPLDSGSASGSGSRGGGAIEQTVPRSVAQDDPTADIELHPDLY